MCLLRQAQIVALPTLWKLPPANVVEESCVASRRRCCEYAVRVHENRRWLPTALGAATGGGLAFGLHAAGVPEIGTAWAMPLPGHGHGARVRASSARALEPRRRRRHQRGVLADRARRREHAARAVRPRDPAAALDPPHGAAGGRARRYGHGEALGSARQALRSGRGGPHRGDPRERPGPEGSAGDTASEPRRSGRHRRFRPPSRRRAHALHRAARSGTQVVARNSKVARDRAAGQRATGADSSHGARKGRPHERLCGPGSTVARTDRRGAVQSDHRRSPGLRRARHGAWEHHRRNRGCA